jgi:RNA polymerase sigma-70 factor (ECF subfamily)
MSTGLDLVLVPIEMFAATDVPDALSQTARGDESEWLAAARAGDTRAFDRLVERHQRSVYRLCYRMAQNADDAADLTQDVFVRAFRAIRSFRGDSAFATWLYRIALNTCRSYRSSRRPPHEELTEWSAVAKPQVMAQMERDERARVVRDAVARLPEKQRATLILKIYQEMTHEQIAATLGTSVGTAKANLFHALAGLRRMLAGSGGPS